MLAACAPVDLTPTSNQTTEGRLFPGTFITEGDDVDPAHTADAHAVNDEGEAQTVEGEGGDSSEVGGDTNHLHTVHVHHGFRHAAKVVALRSYFTAASNRDGAVALRSAILIGNKKMVDRQLHAFGGQGALEYRDFADWQVIHSAANQGRACLVADLIKAGSEPNSRTALGHTPLQLAAQHGNIHTMQVLLACGALPSIPDRHGMLPIHIAASLAPLSKTVACVTALLRGESCTTVAVDGMGYSLLATAAVRGDVPLAAMLLGNGVATSGPSFVLRSTHTFATLITQHEGFAEAVEMLLYPPPPPQPEPAHRPASTRKVNKPGTPEKKGKKKGKKSPKPSTTKTVDKPDSKSPRKRAKASPKTGGSKDRAKAAKREKN